MPWFAALSPFQRSAFKGVIASKVAPKVARRREHLSARGRSSRATTRVLSSGPRGRHCLRPVCEGEHERADGRVVVFAEDRVGAGADLFRRGHALELGDEVWGWAYEPAGVACLAVELLRAASRGRSSSPCGRRCRFRPSTSPALPNLLGQPDKKAFRPADVAEPIRVFVLNHFAADELRTVLAEPPERLVDVIHGEHDA